MYSWCEAAEEETLVKNQHQEWINCEHNSNIHIHKTCNNKIAETDEERIEDLKALKDIVVRNTPRVHNRTVILAKFS